MATKEQERKALEQIVKIVEGLGEDSYIGTAFEGCFEIAKQNIENDWACSILQRAEAAERNFERTHEAWEKVTSELKLAKKTLADESDRRKRVMIDFDHIRIEKFEAENRAGVAESKIVDLENEILHLKAKLYDLMTK